MRRFNSHYSEHEEESDYADSKKVTKKFMAGKRNATRHNRKPPMKATRKIYKRGKAAKFRTKINKKSRNHSDDEYENYFFSKEWRNMDRRQRRFTKTALYELHERAEEIKRSGRYENEEREERLQEMDDILDEMEDYISDYRKKKEIELTRKDKGGDTVLAKSWRKYPKPGSNPQVTFKPEHFLLRNGFLYKKGLKWRHWKKRFFRIFLDDPHTLRYYSSTGQAEIDASIDKRLRKGKKINLLFANIYSSKDKSKLFNKRKHKNKNIVSTFKLFIQTKTIKKIRNAKNEIEKKIILNRIYHLCCLSEIEFDNWYKTLKYIEEQTQKCIKEHESKIAKGLELKRLYFKQKKKQGKKSEDNQEDDVDNKDIKDKVSDEKQDVRELAKHDRAQNIKAYGSGIKQAIAGEKSTFIIEDCFKPSSKKMKLKERFDLSRLSVVLESNELHYDLEPVPLDKTKKLICQYLLTRKGEYELSIMYDGLDIYGSPMRLYVTPAKLSSTHTYLTGQKYILSGAQTNELKVNFRNIFEERVGVTEKIGLDIQCSEQLEIINKSEIETFVAQRRDQVSCLVIKYVVKPNADRKNETEWVSIQIDDKIATPSFLRHVKNSPFSVQVIEHPGYVQEPEETEFALKNSPHQATPIQSQNPNSTQQDVTTERLRVDTANRGTGYFTAPLDSSYLQEDKKSADSYFVRESLFSPQRVSTTREAETPLSSPLSPQRQDSPYNKKVLKLFQQHETVMRSLYQHFGSDLSGIVQFGIAYDIVPTFISNGELSQIYNKLPKNSSGTLDLDWFEVCLAQIAIFSLSKPMFAHLYSTDKSKINVLLNMWGVADPQKITNLRERSS